MCGMIGLKVNDKKTKYAIIGLSNREHKQRETVEVEGYKLKKSFEFQILGINNNTK